MQYPMQLETDLMTLTLNAHVRMTDEDLLEMALLRVAQELRVRFGPDTVQVILCQLARYGH